MEFDCATWLRSLISCARACLRSADFCQRAKKAFRTTFSLQSSSVLERVRNARFARDGIVCIRRYVGGEIRLTSTYRVA